MDLLNLALILVNSLVILILSLWILILIIPKKRKEAEIREIPLPNISVIIATYNEAKNIGKCIAKVKSAYPKEKLEIVVVDDNSSDKTREIAASEGARVIRVRGFGKAKSLNKGISVAKNNILIFLDADVFIDKDDIVKIVNEINRRGIGVVVGRLGVSPTNRPLEIFQEMEYNLVYQLAESHIALGVPLPFASGQIIAFKRKTLQDIGGFDNDTISEDTDAYLKALSRGWRVSIAKTNAKTVSVSKISELIKQRIRWMLGGIQLFSKYTNRKAIKHNLAYPLITLISWPIGVGTSLLLNVFPFMKWFPVPAHISLDYIKNILVYVTRWFTFVGVPWGWMDLPKWGYPLAPTTGIITGTLALVLLVISLLKRREKRPSRWVLLVFFPIYGWVLMGICGSIAMIEYILNPRKTFKSSKTV